MVVGFESLTSSGFCYQVSSALKGLYVGKMQTYLLDRGTHYKLDLPAGGHHSLLHTPGEVD